MKRRALHLLLAGSLALFRLGGPSDAGAAEEELEYVGTDECLVCHDGMEKAYSRNVHSKAAYWDEKSVGCESCHGPGSRHAENDGEVRIGSPTDLGSREANQTCLSCHDAALDQTYWQGSAHERLDVTCVSCHRVHGGHDKLLSSESQSESCFECHPDQRTYLLKRSHHPLYDSSRKSGLGKMRCSDCHNPHGTQSEKLISANSINDKCYECHREMQAPVLWEHSPVKENCLHCHSAHGSNYPNMLVLQRTRLCQECHEAGRHQTVAGQGISFVVLNRGCNNCHAQVHGSNHPSGLKLKR